MYFLNLGVKRLISWVPDVFTMKCLALVQHLGKEKSIKAFSLSPICMVWQSMDFRRTQLNEFIQQGHLGFTHERQPKAFGL